MMHCQYVIITEVIIPAFLRTMKGWIFDMNELTDD